MEQIVSIALDITVVAIVLYCMRAAAKKGFLRTVIQMIAYVVVLVAASFLSRAIAPVVYEHIVEPIILESTRQEQPQVHKANAALISMMPQGMLATTGTEQGYLEELSEQIADKIDLQELEKLIESGIDMQGLQELLPQGINMQELQGLLPDKIDPQNLAEDLMKEITQAALRPIILNAISLICFVLLFGVLSLIANILLSALGIINYLPIIGGVNALLGGVVGVLQGLLLVWILGVLAQGMLYLYPQGWGALSRQAVEQTYLFRYFINPELLKQLTLLF